MAHDTEGASFHRQAGFWLALLLVLAQGVNAVRAAVDPVGFAAYFGVPLASDLDAAWVGVYGLRTAFIALLAAWLLWQRELRALTALAVCALILPVGDLWLAHQAGAGAGTLVRHALIGGVLTIAAVALARWARHSTAR